MYGDLWFRITYACFVDAGHQQHNKKVLVLSCVFLVLQVYKGQFLLYQTFTWLLWCFPVLIAFTGLLLCCPVLIAWIILVLSRIDRTNMGGLRREIIIRDLTNGIEYTDVHTHLHTERKICNRNIIVITNFLL